MITVTKISFWATKIIGLIIGFFGLWFIIDGIKQTGTLGILEIVPGFALFFFGSFLIILVFLSEGKTKLIKYPLVIIAIVVFAFIGICVYFEYFHRVSLTQLPEIKKQENVIEDETADWQTTEVIKYIPTEIPSEIKEGHCWVNSISAPRKGAWRCMIESSISDPCFVINGSEDLVCDFAPITGDKGFLLKLTEPLPEDTATDYYGQGWGWLIQLEDGITCRFITGATGGINNERINYYCSDDSFVIGDLEVGTIWKAKKVDNPQTKSIEVVSIKKVWQ